MDVCPDCGGGGNLSDEEKLRRIRLARKAQSQNLPDPSSTVPGIDPIQTITNTPSPTGLPNPSNIAEEDALSWLELLLGWKETPLAMAAIQVLTVDGLPLIIGLTAGIGPEDLPIALALFGVSRLAAIIGTASTLYQYQHNMYGTQMTDVVVSTTTLITGFIPIPQIYLASVHVDLFYTFYRYIGGGLPPIFP
jgi:hypothetical protein